MKIFIWKYIAQVSHAYHSSGGLVVIAENEARAREIANLTDEVNLQPHESVSCVFNIEAEEEDVIVFPNAGCC